MAEQSKNDDGADDAADDGGITEALRTAIERTLEATAGSAAGTRERAAEVVDQVTRRGDEARREMSRRGQEAREASAALTSKVVEAIEGMRLARGEDVRAIAARIESLEGRLVEIEAELGKSEQGPKGKGGVEG